MSQEGNFTQELQQHIHTHAYTKLPYIINISTFYFAHNIPTAYQTICSVKY